MNVDAVNSLLRQTKENHRRRHVAGASHAAVLTINATAMHAKARASNRLAKQKRTRENPKESRKVSWEQNIQARAKALRKVCRASNIRDQKQTQSLTNLNRRFPQKLRVKTTLGVMTFGVTLNGMMDGVQQVGMKAGIKRYDNSQAHVHSEVLILSPRRFEWVRMNFDTGAAVNTCPLNFGSEGAGYGRCYRTASGKVFLMFFCVVLFFFVLFFLSFLFFFFTFCFFFSLLNFSLFFLSVSFFLSLFLFFYFTLLF